MVYDDVIINIHLLNIGDAFYIKCGFYDEIDIYETLF